MLHTYVATLLSSRPTTMQNIDSINTNINIDVFEITIVKKKEKKIKKYITCLILPNFFTK